MATLGAACCRHHWIVIIFWISVALLAATATPKLTDRLLSGSGSIEDSMSSRAQEILKRDFPALGSQVLLFVFDAPSMTERQAEAVRRLAVERFEKQKSVRSTGGLEGLLPDGDADRMALVHVVVLRLATNDLLGSEQEVALLRQAIAPVMRSVQGDVSGLEWAMTGPAALTHDLNNFSARDSARAELRALPLTLAVLLFAFGSIAAAIFPLILAVIVRTVALGILFLIAGSFEVSNLVVGIVTMLSIALGIDYSLFLIDRFRSQMPGRSTEEAMRRAFADAGPALLFSGLTVVIGMSGLLMTPLMQTRSIGLGGLLAVVVSLAAALTLAPAIRASIPTRWFEWRPFGPEMDDRRRIRWQSWAHRVLRHPWIAGAASLVLILLIAAPASQMNLGVPDERFLPKDLEYVRGLDLLADNGLKGLAAPITVIVSDTSDGPAITSDRVTELSRFVRALENHPASASVIAPDFLVASRPLPFPVPNNSALISDNERRFAIRIIPESSATIETLQSFTAQIANVQLASGLSIAIDGQAQYYNDFDRSVIDSYPTVIGLVLGLSAMALLLMFRAPLVALKALTLNLLSVVAGFGAVVFVFQLGHGAELFGVGGGTGAIPATIPLIIFAVLFGVSMDYEIFLLARVRDRYLGSLNSNSSIADGLADTGAVITSAALVMIGVFGAFAFADLIVVQMLGLGLAVAVLVDAMLIRTLLGPALMQLAGHWNWWPMSMAKRREGG